MDDYVEAIKRPEKPSSSDLEAMARADVADYKLDSDRKYSTVEMENVEEFKERAKTRLDALDPENDDDAQILQIAQKVIHGMDMQERGKRTLNEYFVEWLIKSQTTNFLKDKYDKPYNRKFFDDFSEEDDSEVYDERDLTQERLREIFFGVATENIIEEPPIDEPEPIPPVDQPVDPGDQIEESEEIVAGIAAHNPEYALALAERRSRQRWTERLMAMDSFQANENQNGFLSGFRRLTHMVTHPGETSRRVAHNLLKSHRSRAVRRDILQAM